MDISLILFWAKKGHLENTWKYLEFVIQKIVATLWAVILLILYFKVKFTSADFRWSAEKDHARQALF